MNAYPFMSMHNYEQAHGTGAYEGVLFFSFSLVCVFTSSLATKPLEIPANAPTEVFPYFSPPTYILTCTGMHVYVNFHTPTYLHRFIMHIR